MSRISSIEPRVAFHPGAQTLSEGGAHFGTDAFSDTVPRVPNLPPGALRLGLFWGMSMAPIPEILARTQVIALVGASAKPARASHRVMAFLQARGYRVIPVNPGLAGGELLGEQVYGALAEIPDEVDMVDIFRAAAHVPQIVEAALARWPDLGCIWMQLGISHEGAARMARARGVDVVMDRCPKIELSQPI